MTYNERSRLLVVGPATFMDSPAARSLRRLKLDIIHVEGVTIDFLLKGANPEIAIVYSDLQDARMSVAISELQCWNPRIPVVVVTRELPPEWPSSCSQVDLDLELATTELVPLVRLLMVLSRSRLLRPAVKVQLCSGYGLIDSGAHIAYLSSDAEDRKFPTQFLAATAADERALIIGSALQNRTIYTKVSLYGAGEGRPHSEGTMSALTARRLDLAMLTVILQKIKAAHDEGDRNLRILSTLGDSSVDRSPVQARLAERLWTRICAQVPAVLVCVFGVGSPQAFDCAIKTHPFVIMGDKLIRNPLCTF